MVNNQHLSFSIHLLVSDLYQGDAIGNFTLSLLDLFRSEGMAAHGYAERHGDVATPVEPYDKFFKRVRPGDLLIYQLSNADPALPEIMSAPCRKAVFYHNITPGHYFRPFSPETADLLDRGRSHLPLLAKADLALANSAWSMAEILPHLRPDTPRLVFPPFLAQAFLSRFQCPVASRRRFSFPYLLALGRMAPHKRMEDVIAIFSFLRKLAPDLNLVIAGSQYPPYADYIKGKIAELPDAIRNKIHIVSGLHDTEIITLLRQAAGLVNASAHEGFAMPLLEAMFAGIPVFANAQGAMRETLSGAGALIDGSHPEEAARVIGRALEVVDNAALLEEQKKRAQALLGQARETSLLDFLKGIG